MQNLEFDEQCALSEVQKLEVLAIANIVNYSLQDTRQITAPLDFRAVVCRSLLQTEARLYQQKVWGRELLKNSFNNPTEMHLNAAVQPKSCK